MRYVVEDTATGFRLTIETASGRKVGPPFDEPGSHGALARIYGELERITYPRRPALANANDPPDAAA